MLSFLGASALVSTLKQESLITKVCDK